MSTNIRGLYLTRSKLGYGRSLKFDHDFRRIARRDSRRCLRARGRPPSKKVNLVLFVHISSLFVERRRTLTRATRTRCSARSQQPSFIDRGPLANLQNDNTPAHVAAVRHSSRAERKRL
jgi:hypothetical protein